MDGISSEVRGVRMEPTSSGLGVPRHNTFALLLRPLAPMAVAVLAVASAAASALGPVTQAAAVGGVRVFVSYADDARPLIANFPNPWAGSPNVTFDGCATSACLTSGFDAGAIRVENDTASSVSVNQVSVQIDTCLYTWTGPLYPVALASGASLIATERQFSLAGCHGPTPNTFDSSDIGLGGLPPSGCTNDGIQPTVAVTVDGATTSYTDTGQILNTGGVDRANCPPGTNESTQWTLIGDVACPGQNLALTPPSQSHGVTETASVTATYTNSGGPTCGQPLSGAAVDFKVTAGPNAGTTGTGVTDVNGMATFSYSSVTTGTDTVEASITNATGATITSNSVAVIWTVAFAPGGGAFVIGDNNSAVGSSVTFWGAQWAKRNSLSGGPAPRSFKGFAESPNVPTCGMTWSADPGNSSPPPAGPLPALMAVIVTSSSGKSGPKISGNIVEIVIVKTNPGYAPNPGHAGTGTVVAVVCSNGVSSPTSASSQGAPRNSHGPAHGGHVVKQVQAGAPRAAGSHSRGNAAHGKHQGGTGKLGH